MARQTMPIHEVAQRAGTDENTALRILSGVMGIAPKVLNYIGVSIQDAATAIMVVAMKTNNPDE